MCSEEHNPNTNNSVNGMFLLICRGQMARKDGGASKPLNFLKSTRRCFLELEKNSHVVWRYRTQEESMNDGTHINERTFPDSTPDSPKIQDLKDFYDTS